MRRTILAALAVLAVAACSEQPAPTAPELSPQATFAATGAADAFVPGRVLARFQPGAAAAAIASAQGAAIQREVTLGILMVSVPAGAELRVAAALARNPGVEFAEPDWIRTFGDPDVMPVNDPFIGYKWDLDNDGRIYNSASAVLATTGRADADMDWREAYDALGGAVPGSVRVGIMDTGVRADHQELVGRIAVQYDFYAGDSNAADDNGHGTHVAGIIGASANNGTGVSGVAFANVTFAIAKVCGRGLLGYGCPLSAIASGITWAVDNGAHVLNLSLGGATGSSTERTALQYARSRNVLPFCAAGNESGPVSYPGAFPECIAVSATDWGDNLASYSNFGAEVELAAPGGDDENADGYSYILSSYYNSSTSYAFMAGTSMASPQAAGLAALLHTLGLTDDDAKLARMTGTADDLGAAGRDNQFGYGRINAFRAVTGGGSPPPPPPPDNQPPTASFTFACTDLACSFDGTGSSDGDGSIVSYAWTFGDGGSATGATPSHTYAAAGTYAVTLTVTDDDGAADGQTQNVTVTSGGSGEGITLTATGSKVKGRQRVDLAWTGAVSASVDVYRDFLIIATTANDGAYTDNIGARGGGSYWYFICEAGSVELCSNPVQITF